MVSKKCSECGEIKPLSEFGKKTKSSDGLFPKCKICRKLEYKENRDYYIKKAKEWVILNPDKNQKTRDDYSKNNKDIINLRLKKYRDSHKEEQSCRYKNWYQENKEKQNEYHRKYRKVKKQNDINYKLSISFRARIYNAIKFNNNSTKAYKSLELLGCSIDELKQHLEQQFTDGMTWYNKGLYGWHIDHIRPCSSFDLSNPEQQKQCFHYSNLQPLWAEDNLKKGAKYGNKKDYKAIAYFSDQVKAVKSKLGYNHSQMGELFGVSRDTYMHWYVGESIPAGDRLDSVMAVIKREVG